MKIRFAVTQVMLLGGACCFTRPGGQGRSILAPRGSAGLGFGIPSAIGAACARPDTTIWALCGDHGVSYSIGELATVVHYGLNIKVLFLTIKGRAGSIITIAFCFREVASRSAGATRTFAAVGRGFGCLGIAVDQPQGVAKALRQAAEHRGPVVVNVSVSGEETPVTSYQKALREKRDASS